MSRLSAMERPSIDTLPLLPHDRTDWSRVRGSIYVMHQHIRYEYPVPISALRQRLMIVPPARHGDQRRRQWWVEISQPAGRRDQTDRFGNRIIELDVARVEGSIEFESHVVVERRPTPRPHRVPVDPTFAQPTRLSAPDAELIEAARQLGGPGSGGAERAERICDWVHRRLDYRNGVTTVDTTAAQALSEGAGVCQDFAHVMLAVCRQSGIAARYVSGHLLGDGGSHAWVEVLLPDPDRLSGFIVRALDPTHNRAAGLNYLTIATGRDYDDVAPTWGTYLSTHPGSLHVRKRVGLTAVEYQTSPAWT